MKKNLSMVEYKLKIGVERVMGTGFTFKLRSTLSKTYITYTYLLIRLINSAFINTIYAKV